MAVYGRLEISVSLAGVCEGPAVGAFLVWDELDDGVGGTGDFIEAGVDDRD